MKRILPLLAIATLLVAAAYPEEQHDGNLAYNGTATGGTKINNLAFNSGYWTGWIYSEKVQAVCFDISFTRSAATGVTMRCETSQSSTTTADAGYDLHELDIAAGTANSYPMTWTYTTSSTGAWTWCVDKPPGKFLECLFDDVASGGANDKITVVARGVSP